MTGWERIEAAIKLGKTDRVPVVPYIDFKFPCRYQGVPQVEALRNPERARQAMFDTFDELGGYDAAFFPGAGSLTEFSPSQAPMAIKRVGKDLPDEAVGQYDEREVMAVEDYDRVLEVGWNRFAMELLCRIWERPLSNMEGRQEKWARQSLRDAELWQEKGVPTLTLTPVYTPLMTLSCSRSLTQFTLDLYRRPDKVAAVMDVMVLDLIDNVISLMQRGGPHTCMVVLERGSGFYYPLKFFERFEFPYLKKMVEAYVAEGITPILHFDTDWSINLPYLRELPRGKCVCEFDGLTNIFNAKEILRDHMCIMGDAPASLLSLGSAQDVEDYCKKLIDIVGQGGGYILSTGCVCPIDAKFENIKAMIDTGKSYLPGSGR